jgi:type IV secretory pathway TrbD component
MSGRRRPWGGISYWTREASKLWRAFQRGRPGRRFQARYYLHRRRRFRGEAPLYGRVYTVFGGLALVTTGLFLSWIVFGIGLWLLAGESLSLARLCDRAEVWLRELARRLKRLWFRSTPVEKALIAAAALACIAALGYGSYRMFPG